MTADDFGNLVLSKLRMFSVELENLFPVHVIALVKLLFRLEKPADIAAFVIAVNVDAVERIFSLWFGLRSDVIIKRQERITPFLADCDAPCSVVRVMIILRI
jgi:hypothetical protein